MPGTETVAKNSSTIQDRHANSNREPMAAVKFCRGTLTSARGYRMMLARRQSSKRCSMGSHDSHAVRRRQPDKQNVGQSSHRSTIVRMAFLTAVAGGGFLVSYGLTKMQSKSGRGEGPP